MVERIDRPIADEGGRPARPYRSIGILAAMERRGAITPAMRGAGDDFRTHFRTAQLDPLHAASPGRGEPGLKALIARQKVRQAILALGALCGPAG